MFCTNKYIILGFNGIVLPVIGDILVDRRDYGEFVNLEDLSAQSPKMLIGAGFPYVFIGVSMRVL